MKELFFKPRQGISCVLLLMLVSMLTMGVRAQSWIPLGEGVKLYHVGSGKYLNHGNDYGTQASLADEGYGDSLPSSVRGRLGRQDTYLIQNENTKSGTDYLFLNESGWCFVDLTNRSLDHYWELEPQDNGTWRIHVAEANPYGHSWSEFPDCYLGRSDELSETVITALVPVDAPNAQLDWIIEGAGIATDDVVVRNGVLVAAPAGTEGTFVVPDGVTTIGANAFCFCQGITAIECGEEVTSFARGCFNGLGDNVTIKAHATVMYDKTLFTVSVDSTTCTLPKGITTIRPYAFAGARLTDVYLYSMSPITPAAHALDGLRGVNIHVYESLLDTYKDVWGNSLTYVSMPDPEIAMGATLNFNNDNDYPWDVVGGTWYSTNHEHDSSATLESDRVEVEPGFKLSFDWMVDSEGCCDRLVVYWNDECLLDEGGNDNDGPNSGTFDRIFNESTSGRLRFVYHKDGSVSSGEDRAVVSNIFIASPFEVENFNVLLHGDEATIASTTLTGDVVIPATVNVMGKDYTVTGFGQDIFRGKSGFTSVTLPATIQSIPDYAFENCSSLSQLVIPGTPAVGFGAFMGCDNAVITASQTIIMDNVLYAVATDSLVYTLPKEVQAIHTGAFASGKLKDLYVHSYNPITPGRGSLDGLSGVTIHVYESLLEGYKSKWGDLAYVTMPNPVIGGTGLELSSNGDFAWQQQEDGSWTVDNFMWEESRLVANVDLKAGSVLKFDYELTGDGYYGYLYCYLENWRELFWDDDYAAGRRTFTYEMPVDYKGRLIFIFGRDGNYSEEEMTLARVSDVTFAEPIVLDDYGVLLKGDELTIVSTSLRDDIEVPETIDVLGKTYTVTAFTSSVFRDRGDVYSVILPPTIKSVPSEAFYNCWNLRTVVIPDEVEYIDNDAFVYTDNARIICNREIVQWGNYLRSVPMDVTQYEVADGITRIGSYAFAGRDQLKSVTFPRSIQEWNSRIFEDCNELSDIWWYSRYVPYLNGALNGVDPCNVTMHIYASLEDQFKERWGDDLNYDLIEDPEPLNLVVEVEKEYQLRDAVNRMLEEMEGSAYDIVSIKVSGPLNNYDDLRYLGELTKGAHSLKDIDLSEASFSEVPGSCFDYGKLESIVLPEGLGCIYWAAFRGTQLRSITLPSTVTNIEGDVFADCRNLSIINSLAVEPPAIQYNTFRNVDKASAMVTVPGIALEAYKSAGYWNEFTNLMGDDTNFFENGNEITLLFPGASCTAGGTGGWRSTIGNAALQYNTWSYEENEDRSGMRTPFIEAWINKYNNTPLADGEVSNVSSLLLPEGYYTVTGKVRAIQELGGDCSGVRFFAGDQEVEMITENSIVCTNGLFNVYSAVVHLTQEEALAIGFKTVNTGCNWVSCKDFHVYYYDNEAQAQAHALSARAAEAIAAVEYPGCDYENGIGDGLFEKSEEMAIAVFDAREALVENESEENILALVHALNNWSTGFTVPDVRKAYAISDAWNNRRLNAAGSAKEGGYEMCFNSYSSTYPYGYLHLQYVDGNRFKIFFEDLDSVAHYLRYDQEENIVLATGDKDEATILSIERYRNDDNFYIKCDAGTLGFNWGGNFNFTPTSSYNRFRFSPLLDPVSLAVNVPEDWTFEEALYDAMDDAGVEDCNSIASLTVTGDLSHDDIYYIRNMARESGMLTMLDLGGITIEDNYLASYAFSDCPMVKVTLPGTLTGIGNNAFEYSRSLQSVNIPDSVTSIGRRAFYNCTSLQSIHIPEAVTYLGEHTFYNCSSLSTVTGLEGVNYERSYECWDIFYGTALSEPVHNSTIFFYMPPQVEGHYDMPEGITMTVAGSIRDSHLSSITLPSTLEHLGDDTFNGCMDMTSITSKALLPPLCHSGVWNEDAFNHDECIITVPEPSLDDYMTSPEWCDFKNYNTFSVGELASVTINVETAGSLDDELFKKELQEQGVDMEMISTVTVTGTINMDDWMWLMQLPDNCKFAAELDMHEARATFEDISREMAGGNRYRTLHLPQGIKSLGYWSFAENVRLKSISLPSTLEVLDGYTFYNTNLKSIELPESLHTIGYDAFNSCRFLESVHIPASVNDLGSLSFAYCTSLREVTGLEGVKAERYGMNNGSFAGCTALSEPVYNSEIFFAMPVEMEGHYDMPQGITVIDRSAMSNSRLSSITLPESLKSIGYNFFQYGRNLETIHIPASVTRLGEYAFDGCTSLREVTGLDGITGDDYYRYWHMFRGCESLTHPVHNSEIFFYMPHSIEGHYDMPDGIRQTTSGSMEGCRISSITLPATLAYMGNDTFRGADNLNRIVSKAITPPICYEGVWDWWDEARKNECTIVVPEPALDDYLGADEWSAFSNYETFEIGELVSFAINVPQAGSLDDDFYAQAVEKAGVDASMIGSLTVTGSLDQDDWAWLMKATGKSSYITRLDMSGAKSTFDEINSNHGRKNVYKTLALPEGIKRIGWGAFQDNKNLQYVVMPASMEYISSYAFARTGLREIFIPDGVNRVEYCAFQSCDKLEEIVFGSSVEYIGEYVAEYCYNLHTVTIPKSLREMGWNAFGGAPIKDFYSYTKRPVDYRNFFYEIDKEIDWSAATLHVYKGRAEMYRDEWGWEGEILEDLGVAEDITITIDDLAYNEFNGRFDEELEKRGIEDATDVTRLIIKGQLCHNDVYQIRERLRSSVSYLDLSEARLQDDCLPGSALNYAVWDTVILPEGLKRIEGHAFYSCSKLKSIDIPESVKFIGHETFRNCTNLTTVTGGEGVCEYDSWEGWVFTATKVNHPVVYGQALYYLPRNCGQYEVPDGVVAMLSSACADNESLTSLTIPGTVTLIGEHVVWGDRNLKDIYYPATDFPELRGNTFDNFDREACTLHVYEEMVEVFQAHETWGSFNIVGDLGSAGSFSEMDAIEYAELCKLYNTLGGENWRTRWITSHNMLLPAAWSGVTFDEGHVTSINLEDNNLAGDISNLKLNLPHLRYLNMNSNSLEGDLAPMANSLEALEELHMGNNRLSDVSEMLSTRIRELNIYGQEFFDAPAMSPQQLYETTVDEGVLPRILFYNHWVQRYNQRFCDNNSYYIYGLCERDNGDIDEDDGRGCLYMSGGWRFTEHVYNQPSGARYSLYDDWYWKRVYVSTYEWIKGDANMDDNMDVLDLQTTVNFSNNWGETWLDDSWFNFPAADTQEDDEIDVFDIVTTVNMLLGITPEEAYAARARRARSRAQAEAWISVEGGEITLHSPERAVAAIDLRLLEVMPDQVVWDGLGKNFSVATLEQEGSTHAIIYSMSGAELPVGTTVIGHVNGATGVSDAVMCDARGQRIVAGNDYLTPVIDAAAGSQWTLIDASGIAVMNGTAATRAEVLTRAAAQGFKGVYILRMGGKAEKVVVK